MHLRVSLRLVSSLEEMALSFSKVWLFIAAWLFVIPSGLTNVFGLNASTGTRSGNGLQELVRAITFP